MVLKKIFEENRPSLLPVHATFVSCKQCLRTSSAVLMVEGGGFEPPKSSDDRFTVCSLWPLGNPSREDQYLLLIWSWRWDSNPQPADYKSAALPVELRQQAISASRARKKTFSFAKNEDTPYISLYSSCQDFFPANLFRKPGHLATSFFSTHTLRLCA